jgi:hypothetical protein
VWAIEINEGFECVLLVNTMFSNISKVVRAAAVVKISSESENENENK